jgi:hypothetical protein
VSGLPKWAQDELRNARSEAADRRVAARTALVDRHAFVAAGELGVNGQALLGSIGWQTRASALDPAAADFADQLKAAIAAELAASPWVKAAPGTPGRSGGEPPNGPQPPAKPTTLHGAVAAAYANRT